MIKPIPFSTDMKSIHFPPPTADEAIRGILANRKTATRRVVKPRYCDSAFEMFRGQLCEASPDKPPIDNGDGTTTHFVRAYDPCKPPYRPGDILYVQEAWRIRRANRYYADAHIEFRAGGGRIVKFEEGGEGVVLLFPHGRSDSANRDDYDSFIGKWGVRSKWHPSIHMPREAARIFLRVTDVQVERLQDITEEQARAEGVSPVMITTDLDKPEDDREWHEWAPALPGFIILWNSTIKKVDRALYGWDANPWVWVIEFERISREEALSNA